MQSSEVPNRRIRAVCDFRGFRLGIGREPADDYRNLSKLAGVYGCGGGLCVQQSVPSASCVPIVMAMYRHNRVRL